VADAIHNRDPASDRAAGITDTIEVDAGVFGCMLGGSDGCILYLCVAPDPEPTARMEARDTRLLAIPVERPRAGRP